MGLALLGMLPIRSVGTKGWAGGRRRRKCWGGTPLFLWMFAVLSIGNEEPFPSRAAPDPFEASQRLCSCPTPLSAHGERGDTGEGMRR